MLAVVGRDVRPGGVFAELYLLEGDVEALIGQCLSDLNDLLSWIYGLNTRHKFDLTRLHLVLRYRAHPGAGVRSLKNRC